MSSIIYGLLILSVFPLHYIVNILFICILLCVFLAVLLWNSYRNFQPQSPKLPKMAFMQRRIIQLLAKKRKNDLELLSRREKLPFSQRVQNILCVLLDFFRRDFICSWSRNISDEILFEEEIMRIIERFIVEVYHRFQSINDNDLIMGKFTNIMACYVNRDFKSNNCMENILEIMVDKSSSLSPNQSSQIFRLLFKRVMNYCIYSSIVALSDPDYINRTFSYLIGNAIHDM